MKTTLDLQDKLMHKVKIRAVHEHKKLKDVIAELLQTARILTSRMSLSGRSRVVFISPYSQKAAFLSIWQSPKLSTEPFFPMLSRSVCRCRLIECRFNSSRTTNLAAIKARRLRSC